MFLRQKLFRRKGKKVGKGRHAGGGLTPREEFRRLFPLWGSEIRECPRDTQGMSAQVSQGT